jgi:hypothetical protein
MTSRFAYVPGTDELIAYFGHTELIQGVRHQGGYLATLDASGSQDVLSDWFGSHNLDQRLLVRGDEVALLGLGDAYPKGVFFSFASDPSTDVIYAMASNGTGATNGQLGGIVDLGDELVVPFITNRSLAQDLDAGTWPDIDETIADQIAEGANNGTDLGLLRVPSSGASGALMPVWLEPARSADARLVSLKSARYGEGGLVLVVWGEATGGSRNATTTYFTMIVDREGAVCQPKTALPPMLAPTSGDDIVRRSDGSIVWANAEAGPPTIVTLTPG